MLPKSVLRLIALFAAVAGPRMFAGGIDSSSKVFVIVMENHDWSSIKGNADAPYINSTLLPIASFTKQYYNPPGIHPSLPNYLWLEAGTNFGITNDNLPSSNHQSTTSHLVTLLKDAGISWRTYQEDITGNTCPTTNSYPYAPKHNPFVYFDDVTSAGCTATMRPFTELANDLANNATAQYNFITPNLINDMHDPGFPLYNPVKQGDNWLAQNVPMILNSSAYQNHGLILITWDEGISGDGPMGLIALSPLAKGGGYRNVVHYTHSSTLRTLQKIFGVRPLLGDAAAAVDLSDLFVANAIPNADNVITLENLTYSSGSCSFAWVGQQGITYRVQWKNDLSAIWQTVIPDKVGNGTLLSWTDDGTQTGSAPAGQRFYRVIIP